MSTILSLGLLLLSFMYAPAAVLNAGVGTASVGVVEFTPPEKPGVPGRREDGGG